MVRLIFGSLLIVSIILSGCAITPAKSLNRLSNAEIEAYNADPNNTDKIICEKSKPIGSNIPRRECHKESYLEDRTRQDQRAIDEIQRNTRPPGP